jgi:penicillin-binding protein 1C
MIRILTDLKQILWERRGYKSRVVLIIILSCLTVRSLPYLAPIKAENLIQDDRALEFSDRNGLPLGRILTRDQDHTAVVPLEEISSYFLQAILAAEDGRFYHHGALDMGAIARAVIQAFQHRRIISGASTITMQLARMLEPNPRTLPAKFQEIWLSWRLTAGMSKDEILSAYINRLPMGSNIYGVEAAARVYFGVPASDLNLAQASILAAIPNNPSYLYPYDHWEALKRRQGYVLKRMREDGYISLEQSERALNEKITLQPRQQGIFAAPHFLFWVADQLPEDHPSHITTTLDRPLQQFVEAQLRETIRNLQPYNVHQGAALVIDNQTGEILAYVGSKDYFNEAELGRNDGVQALRQPGSTLKPFLYQLALEKEVIKSNTILADIPTHYAIPGAKLYSPKDFSETFLGPVRVRVALANSLNIPAVRILEKVGVNNFLDRLHQLGFNNLDQTAEHYGLGLVLGAGEVSLWQLTGAYFILAHGGEKESLNFVKNDLIPPLNKGGSNSALFPLIKGGSRGDQNLISQTETIGDQSSWELITNILSDRHSRANSFGVDSVLSLPFPVAVKTGTSSNFRDTWTVGYTRNYTVATWIGNFDGKPMEKISGVMGAAPLWHRIMLYLHQAEEPLPFPSPKGMIQKPICALSGLKPTGICPSVVQEYFNLQDLGEYESKPDNFYEIVDQENIQYRLNLPREYDQWLAEQNRPNLVTNSFKILAPNADDLFMISSSQELSERLEFKITGISEKPVEWWLNNQKIAMENSNSFFWEMKPGNWTLKVINGENIDQVNFRVKIANTKQNRRGFSY